MSDSWRQKAAAATVTTEPGAKESQMAEGSQQEEKEEGEKGEKAEKEDGAVAASPGETGDTNKVKTATCEVRTCMWYTLWIHHNINRVLLFSFCAILFN